MVCHGYSDLSVWCIELVVRDLPIMEEIKSFFTSRGLGTSELAKGLVIHEVDLLFFSNLPENLIKTTFQVLGVAIMFSAWGGCYFLRPSARSTSYVEPRKKLKMN